MADERATWIQQSYQLALVTAGFHFIQFLAAAILWSVNRSASLAAFGLDAIVSGFAAIVLAFQRNRAS